jgi:release factor glutamine methyltransferase
VLNFEPHIALFVEDNNPLVFYNKIAKLATQSLNIGGVLFFEINPLLSKEIKILLCGLGFVDIELKKDINDKIRMVKAIWK